MIRARGTSYVVGVLTPWPVVDVVRNPLLEGSDMRVVWVVLVVLVGLGAMPGYWWLHLRPGSEAFRARTGGAPEVR